MSSVLIKQIRDESISKKDIFERFRRVSNLIADQIIHKGMNKNLMSDIKPFYYALYYIICDYVHIEAPEKWNASYAFQKYLESKNDGMLFDKEILIKINEHISVKCKSLSSEIQSDQDLLYIMGSEDQIPRIFVRKYGEAKWNEV